MSATTIIVPESFPFSSLMMREMTERLLTWRDGIWFERS